MQQGQKLWQLTLVFHSTHGYSQVEMGRDRYSEVETDRERYTQVQMDKTGTQVETGEDR